jgi:hypothetical protein
MHLVDSPGVQENQDVSDAPTLIASNIVWASESCKGYLDLPSRYSKSFSLRRFIVRNTSSPTQIQSYQRWLMSVVKVSLSSGIGQLPRRNQPGFHPTPICKRYAVGIPAELAKFYNQMA